MALLESRARGVPAPHRPETGLAQSDESFQLAPEARHGLFRDGFLALESVTDAADLADIRALVAPWLNGPPRLHRGARARDLGAGPQSRIREVTNLTRLEPRLLETRFFRRAFSATEALFGPGARLMFDHVIHKPAYNGTATDWHQDCAYGSPLTFSARRLHWWLPLQDATVENGCMQFARGSHAGPVLPHRRITPGGHPRTIHGPPDPTQVVACPLPAGGATIHLPKTLHYTGPNQTAGQRLAWIVQIGVRSRLPMLL